MTFRNFLFLCLLSQLAYSQNAESTISGWPVCAIKGPEDSIVINKFIQGVITDHRNLSFSEFQKVHHAWFRIVPDSGFVPNYKLDQTYWFRFIVENQSQNSVELFFKCPYFEFMTMYSQRADGKIDSSFAGNQRAQQDLDYKCSSRYFRDTIQGGATIIYTIRGSYLVHVNYRRSQFSIGSKLYAERDCAQQVKDDFPERVFDSVILGILFIFSVYFMLQYLFVNREKAELFYSLYLLCMFSATLRYFEGVTYVNLIFSWFNGGAFYMEAEFVYLAVITYTLFIRHFLDFKRLYPNSYYLFKDRLRFPGTYTWTNVMIWTCIALIIVDILLKFFSGLEVAMLFYIGAGIPILAPIGFCFLLPVIFSSPQQKRIEKNLGKIIVAGTLTLILFSLISVLINQLRSYSPFSGWYLFNNENSILRKGGTWFRSGLAFEVLIFATGLAYKQRQYELNRLGAHSRNLIAQLGMHLENNLFTILNSYFSDANIPAEQKERIDNLIAELGRYTRTTLHQFRDSDLLTLKEELGLSEMYLRLLKQVKPQLHFTIASVNAAELLSEVSLPPLIIQPIIENSFKHAFFNENPNWEIRISVTQVDGRDVILEIQDNGIGMKQSTVEDFQRRIDSILNGGKNFLLEESSSHVGIRNTAERIHLHNLLHPQNKISLEISSHRGENSFTSFRFKIKK